MPKEAPPIGTPQFADYMKGHFRTLAETLRDISGDPEKFTEYVAMTLSVRMDPPPNSGLKDMTLVDLRGQCKTVIKGMANLIAALSMTFEEKGVCDKNAAADQLVAELLQELQSIKPVVTVQDES